MDRRRQAMTLLGFPPCMYCEGYTEVMLEHPSGGSVCTSCNHKMDLARVRREHAAKLAAMKDRHEYQMTMIGVMASMDRPASASYVAACQSETMKSDLEAIMGTGRLVRRGRIR